MLKKLFFMIVMLSGTSLPSQAEEPLPARVFSHPDRIRYDSQCFTVEGKDTFIFSGAFHYFRCPKELWSDRFDKIKSAGFNTVETYVAWNVSESTMPASVDDYSKVDLKDLDDWLTMAESKGLYVILRPGPYICAEWDCGGLPQWLLAKRPVGYRGLWVRSDEPLFAAWSRHWYHAVNQVAVKHQISHRQPGQFGIILYQLENEYDFSSQPTTVKEKYVHLLGQQAMDDGIDVPLFTCWTECVRGNRDPVLRQVYDSCNFYPRYDIDSIAKDMTKLRNQQSDAPLQTTELQGGWFSGQGQADSLSDSWTRVIDTCSPAQIQNLTFYAIEKGDRITNYYMLFGGTNFGDYAPSGITTSYDYSAPIREIGCVGEKYQTVAAIGAMLKEHGERLTRAEPIECKATTDQKDVTVAARRAQDGTVYLFFRTSQHTEPRAGNAKIEIHYRDGNGSVTDVDTTVAYDLPPFGSKILVVADPKSNTESGWLPKPVAEMKRPVDGLPTSIKLTTAMHKDDAGPVEWKPLADGKSLEELGVYDRRFVYYRTDVAVDAKSPETMLNLVGPQRDGVLALVNGGVAAGVTHPGGHQVEGLHAGDNRIEVLYENAGQPNFGNGVEDLSGIRKIQLLADDGAIAEWRMVKLPAPADGKFRADRLPEITEGFDDSKWNAVKIKTADDAEQLEEGEYGVFRASVVISDDQLKSGGMTLQLSRMDDVGWVFINGKRIGDGKDWSIPYAFAARGLRAGKNSVAVVIQNKGGKGGLGMVNLIKSDPSVGASIEIGLGSSGFAGKWWKSDLDESGWNSQQLSDPTGGLAVLSWDRMKFSLPAQSKGTWVPWVARIEMSGNGFLYLNDRALGRYWQAGPQRDFFLPECWLNFGAGKSNVLTMCVRSVDGKPVIVKSVQIVPVNEVAEYR